MKWPKQVDCSNEDDNGHDISFIHWTVLCQLPFLYGYFLNESQQHRVIIFLFICTWVNWGTDDLLQVTWKTPAISVHSLNFILQWFPSLKKTSRKHRQKQHIHIATQNNHVIPRIFSILLTTSHNIFLETILALHYQKVKFYFIVRQLTIRVSQLLGSSQEFTVKSLILRSEARKQLGVARICFLL